MELEYILQNVILTNLILDAPVLSGNMQNHIGYEGFEDNGFKICISGPSYDQKKWQKTKQIVLTNEYDYALSVNRLGAFGGRSTKSQYWANRSVVRTVQMIANMYGAEVKVDVPI